MRVVQGDVSYGSTNIKFSLDELEMLADALNQKIERDGGSQGAKSLSEELSLVISYVHTHLNAPW